MIANHHCDFSPILLASAPVCIYSFSNPDSKALPALTLRVIK